MSTHINLMEEALEELHPTNPNQPNIHDILASPQGGAISDPSENTITETMRPDTEVNHWRVTYLRETTSFVVTFWSNTKPLVTLTAMNREHLSELINIAIRDGVKDFNPQSKPTPPKFETVPEALSRGITIKRIPAVDRKSPPINLTLADLGF